MEKQNRSNYKHFVLVHGACHGAWSWYKLVTLLEKAGHKVTTVDLMASGRQPLRIDEVHSFKHYLQPLMELLSSHDLSHKDNKDVILVGHSLGGIAVSLAIEAFPEKIAAAVYVAGIAPAIDFTASEFFDQFFRRNNAETLLDTQVLFDDGPENPPTSLWFGEKLIAARMYQLCQPEDIKLGSTLLRPTKLFLKELANKSLLTKERFGSVDRVYIICKEDDMLEDLQEWMIEKASIEQVMTIEASDHMPMLCKPQMLLNCLLQVAEKYV